MTFSENCRACPRLSGFLDEVRTTYPDYHARPVSSFGPERSRLLIVGLAPGLHGANRTGRPFTGDHAGGLLYSTLHDFGFSSSPEPLVANGESNPNLLLQGCRISNAVRCLPPQNKPLPAEIRQCNVYLAEELEALPQKAAILALGTIAHSAVLQALGLRLKNHAFAHAARHELPQGRVLYDSYHCSRYNTQTRRLTETMFHDVFHAITAHLNTLGTKRQI